MAAYLPFAAKVDGVTTIAAADVNNLQTAMSDLTFNVKGYGAVGDDSTDDTVAVQAAITAANAAGGGVVYFPKGTYQCNKLTTYSKVSLVGVGSVASIVKLRTTQNTALLTTDGFQTADLSVGIYGFRIADLTFDGNKANQTSNADSGVVQIYGYFYNLRNVDVRNGKTVGLYTNWGTATGAPGALGESMESYYENVKSYLNTTDGFFLNGPHDSVFVGCTSYSNGAKGFNIGARGNSGKFLSCHAWDTTQTEAWHIDGIGVQLIDCEGEGASSRQIICNASDFEVYGGHYFAAGGGTTGVEIANSCSGLTINTKLSNFTTASVLLTTNADASIFDLNIYATAGVALSGTLSANSRFRALVNGGQTGAVVNGPRFLPGMWTQENVAASQTNSYCYLLGGESAAATPRWHIPMLRAGSITGLIVRVDGSRTAGTLTITVHKNDVATALTAVIDGTNTAFKGSYASPGTYTYAIGDELGIFVTTDGSWAPTTADLMVEIEVSD